VVCALSESLAVPIFVSTLMTRKLPDYYNKNATDSTDYHGFKKIIRGIRGVLFLLDRHRRSRLEWCQLTDQSFTKLLSWKWLSRTAFDHAEGGK